jgi:hypothetical protein
MRIIRVPYNYHVQNIDFYILSFGIVGQCNHLSNSKCH